MITNYGECYAGQEQGALGGNEREQFRLGAYRPVFTIDSTLSIEGMLHGAETALRKEYLALG